MIFKMEQSLMYGLLVSGCCRLAGRAPDRIVLHVVAG
jgi:hypothetical protein